MRESITQEFEYGCGVACFAFAMDLTYREAVERLGREQSVKYGWRPSDLTAMLNRNGLAYRNTYVRKTRNDQEHPDGTIVLIERSPIYKAGHYFIRYHSNWMDPWINMPESNLICEAKSGFRQDLPGKAMYAIVPFVG